MRTKSINENILENENYVWYRHTTLQFYLKVPICKDNIIYIFQHSDIQPPVTNTQASRIHKHYKYCIDIGNKYVLDKGFWVRKKIIFKSLLICKES